MQAPQRNGTESEDGRQSWVPFLSKSRADQHPGPRPAGDGPRDDRLHRRAIQGDRRGMLCRPEAGVQDRPDHPRLCRLRARRVGGGAGQSVLARRQGAGRRKRLFLAELGHARPRRSGSKSRHCPTTGATPSSPAKLESRLREDREHAIKAVLVVHNETSTGVAQRHSRACGARSTPPSIRRCFSSM